MLEIEVEHVVTVKQWVAMGPRMRSYLYVLGFAAKIARQLRIVFHRI